MSTQAPQTDSQLEATLLRSFVHQSTDVLVDVAFCDRYYVLSCGVWFIALMSSPDKMVIWNCALLWLGLMVLACLFAYVKLLIFAGSRVFHQSLFKRTFGVLTAAVLLRWCPYFLTGVVVLLLMPAVTWDHASAEDRALSSLSLCLCNYCVGEAMKGFGFGLGLFDRSQMSAR